MILFYLLFSLVSLCYGQNAALSFKCSEAVGNTLTIEAVYSGTGTPLSVIWTYSGASLIIETGGCTVFGGVPAGFIDSSRLSYECVTTKPSLPPDTYKLLVSGLQDDILGKTWAVTFTPPVGVAPVPESSNAPSECSGTTSTTLSSSSTNIIFTNTATTIPSSTKFSTTNSPGEDISTTTTTSTSTTTTTPASSTMTTSSTTTTNTPTTPTTFKPSIPTTTKPPTTTTNKPSTTTNTPTSTRSPMPITTTSMRMPITISMPSTTSTTLTSNSTFSTQSYNEGLSDEKIIVIVIVPVGVIAVVGTVIFFCLFYRLRRAKRKPASHERHKQGRHYKGNMRSVQQHQQQLYILYGRGHARESNHKETKRSRTLHNDDRYNLYEGYLWGNQVKQNPVYKGDRNLDRLYYNETLPRYDAYRSGYTTGHVYPSHISGYHYRPDYHGDSRGHGNRQHFSYPVYSRQLMYINPSYSYMGY